MITYRSARDAGLTFLNYWGDGSDGNLNTTENVLLSNVQDGDIVVKKFRNLTVNAGHTLTVQNRCRGLFIFVNGNLTVNGTISMTKKGCKCNPADSSTSTNTPVAPGDGHGVGVNGIRIPFVTGIGSQTLSQAEFEGCGSVLYALRNKFPSIDGNGTIITIKRSGAAGGAAVTGWSVGVDGNNGSNGSAGESGGGGSGGVGDTDRYSGAGTAGTCFCGGTGGGGNCWDRNANAESGAEYGGKGGDGSTNIGGGQAGGGAGNPGGANDDGGTGYSYDGDDGCGGLLVILCSGQVNIGSGGKIEANGGNGGSCFNANYASGGGASGGGNLVLVHAGDLDNNGVIQAAGGSGGTHGNPDYYPANGGNGGAGSVQVLQVTA
jgi:hypothetical protein